MELSTVPRFRTSTGQRVFEDRRCISLVGFVFCFLILALAARTETIRGQEEGPLVFENQYARLVIGREGEFLGLIDRVSGKDYLDHEYRPSFMKARRGNVEYPATLVEPQDGHFRVEFDGSGIEALMNIETAEKYFTFELVSINQHTMDELVLLDLPLTILERVPRVQEFREHSETINVARNDEFGVSLASVNLITHSRPLRYEPAAFQSSCYPPFGMEGAKVAVIAGPADELLSFIGEMEVEQGLPHPTLGGVWGKISPEAKKSYLFVDFTEENIDQVIELAKAGGFSYILNYGGTWATSSGKYEVNRNNFPNGLAGVKAVMDKIHAAGLKGGAHILSGCIDKDNDYVTPVPDRRLAKDDMRFLARDISAEDTVLFLTDSPEGFPEREGRGFASGTSLQLGDEIITYSGMSQEPPYAFTGCTRGANGTRATEHPKGTRVYHLGQRWGRYSVDGNSSLLEEVAQNVADVINYCGFDLIYFDGLDCVEVNGPFFYYVGKMVAETAGRFNREVIIQGSNLAHINWHNYSRLYTIDFAYYDQKGWVDHHCRERMQNARNNLIPAELGWFGYFLESDNSESTTPDIIEYVLAKTVGWDVAWSLETRTDRMLEHGRTEEILAMIQTYEKLRLSGYFSEATREQLRTPDQDFKLVQTGDNEWRFHPISYGPAQLMALNGTQTASFELENRYEAQPFRVRLKALPSPAPFEDARNQVLIDPETNSILVESSEDASIQGDLSVSTEEARDGDSVLRLTARNLSGDPSGWIGWSTAFSEPIDMRQGRDLGFWIKGDGSGAILNVRIYDSGGYFSRDHLVTLDFTGWQYQEFREPTGIELEDYSFPDYDLRSLRGINYGEIASVTVFLTHVPAGGETTCFVSRIEALHESPSVIESPSIRLGDGEVVFPVTIENGHYLEYWGEGSASLYDGKGVELEKIVPKGSITVVPSGQNVFEVHHRPDDPARRELRVEIITMGEALPR